MIIRLPCEVAFLNAVGRSAAGCLPVVLDSAAGHIKSPHWTDKLMAAHVADCVWHNSDSFQLNHIGEQLESKG